MDLRLPFQPATATRGRRPCSFDRRTRLKHIRCAYRRLFLGQSIASLKRRYRVSSRAIALWVRAAMRYDDPEAEALRRLFRSTIRP